MNTYAFFNTDGYCESTITSAHPGMIIPDGYEEITDENEIKLLRLKGRKCKRILDENGQRKIIVG